MTRHLALLRPHNCIAAALSALLGVHLAGRDAPSLAVVTSALIATACAVGAANALNDVIDRDEDALNAPHRPIPSGALSVRAASIVAGCTLLAGVVAGAWLPAAAWTPGVLLAGAGLAYSRWFKRTILTGNVMVGVLSGGTVPFGALVAGRLSAPALAAGGIVALFVTAREILKTIADREGDARVGRTTISTRLGAPAALRAFRVVALVAIVTIPLPWFAGLGDRRYLALMTVGVALPLAWLACTARAHTLTAPGLRLWLRTTKVSWFLGLLGLATLRG